jgi:flagellar biogenesis protein FliO
VERAMIDQAFVILFGFLFKVVLFIVAAWLVIRFLRYLVSKVDSMQKVRR